MKEEVKEENEQKEEGKENEIEQMENEKSCRYITKVVLIGPSTAVKIDRELGSSPHLQTNFVVSAFSMFEFVVVITFVV